MKRLLKVADRIHIEFSSKRRALKLLNNFLRPLGSSGTLVKKEEDGCSLDSVSASSLSVIAADTTPLHPVQVISTTIEIQPRESPSSSSCSTFLRVSITTTSSLVLLCRWCCLRRSWTRISRAAAALKSIRIRLLVENGGCEFLSFCHLTGNLLPELETT